MDESRPALVVQGDGNLVVYVNNGIGWSSNSWQQLPGAAYTFVVSNNAYSRGFAYLLKHKI